MWVHRQASAKSAGAPLPAVGNLGGGWPVITRPLPPAPRDVLPSSGNSSAPSRPAEPHDFRSPVGQAGVAVEMNGRSERSRLSLAGVLGSVGTIPRGRAQ